MTFINNFMFSTFLFYRSLSETIFTRSSEVKRCQALKNNFYDVPFFQLEVRERVRAKMEDKVPERAKSVIHKKVCNTSHEHTS